jgi:ABC-type polysaccharide/polyol phosphate export permease
LLYAYFANPMTGIVSAYRTILLGEPFPFLRTAMLSFAFAWAVLPLGILFFQRLQVRFADEL